MKKTTLSTIAILATLSANNVLAEEIQAQTEPQVTTEQSVTTTTETEVTTETKQEETSTNAASSLEVTSVEIATDAQGQVTTYENVEAKLEFSVTGDVVDGQTETIAIPESFKFTLDGDKEIDLQTENSVNFAKANYSYKDNNVTITFNKHAEELENIRGGLLFNIQLRAENVAIGDTVDTDFVVGATKVAGSSLTYVGYSKDPAYDFKKGSWQSGDGTTVTSSIEIGKSGNGYKNLVIHDDILDYSEDNADYIAESMRVLTGEWAFDEKYGWNLTGNVRDVTDLVQVTYSTIDRSFVLTVDSSLDNQDLHITYKSNIIAGVSEGETIDNKIVVFEDGAEIGEWVSFATIRNLSGWIIGNIRPVSPEPENPVEPEKEPEPAKEVEEVTEETKEEEDTTDTEVEETQEEKDTESVEIGQQTVEFPKVDDTENQLSAQTLPETGEKENKEVTIILAILAVIFGCMFAFLIAKSKEDSEN